ncbi:MAG TPA: acyltransferase [Acidimicrobiia bacterium]
MGAIHRFDRWWFPEWLVDGKAPSGKHEDTMQQDGSGGTPPGRRRLADLADATPDKRDRYVDFLRALSVVVVVLGHWLGAVVYLQDGELTATSALDVVPGLWIITWALQIMPIFFFVGGFSNFVTYEGLQRLGEGPGVFLKGRASRLLRPVGIFLLFWAIVAPFALQLDLPDGAAEKAVLVLLGPLWFICAYLMLVLMAPVMVFLHRKFRIRVLVALVLIPVAIDLLRFAGDVPVIGWFNFLFVWLFIHQFGFFYADGTFDRVSRSLFWIMAIGGFAAMVGLTQMQVYPASMVGCCSDEISNMAPPTLAIMVFGVYQVGLSMLLRPSLTKWLARKRPWSVVIAINSSIMTLFLWHLSALVIAASILLPLGFPQPEMGSVQWWLTRPLWFGAAGLVLALLVFIWGRFERPDLDPAEQYWDLEEFYAL